MAEGSPTLRINRVAVPIGNLGFGQRAAIWVQGCTIACPGCIARHTWNRKGGEVMPVAELAELIELLEARGDRLDGLTISGGEPLEQADPVFELVHTLRNRAWLGPDRDVLVYSGLEAHELDRRFGSRLEAFDVIVAGPYLDDNSSDGLMGSRNQQVLAMTELGQKRYSGVAQPRRPMEGLSNGDVVLLSGIPDADTNARFASLLAEYGLRMVR